MQATLEFSEQDRVQLREAVEEVGDRNTLRERLWCPVEIDATRVQGPGDQRGVQHHRDVSQDPAVDRIRQPRKEFRLITGAYLGDQKRRRDRMKPRSIHWAAATPPFESR